MFLLSVYYVLLARMSGQSDIIIGTEVLGRTHPAVKGVVGSFVNVLPLRVEVSPESAFAELLYRVKACVVGAYENQDFQFEQMVALTSAEESRPGNPIFDFYFSLANAVDSHAELARLEFDPVELERRIKGEYEFAIQASELDTSRMNLVFIYSHQLYDEETVRLMMAYYHSILKRVLQDAEARLEDLETDNHLTTSC
jgi:non-ribosomal peptide synthetase component F